MDPYAFLAEADEPTAQERARAITQALRRDKAAGLLGAMTGNKLIAPMAQQLTQGARQGEENLQQATQFRLTQAMRKRQEDEARQRYTQEQTYRQGRDTVEDQFRRQQLAKQPSGPAPRYEPSADGTLHEITPRGARPVLGPDGQPFKGAPKPASYAGSTRLRGEFQKQPTVKATSDMADAISKIRAAPEDGAGDLSLIYSYVKILDPGSVVREGEIKLAREPTPLLAKLTQQYQKAAKGQLLDPGVRGQYKQAAEALWESQHQRYEEVAAPYRQLAEAQGLNPNEVILDFYGKTVAGGPGGAPAMSPEDQQAKAWADANPQDPRAAAILQKLAAKGR